MQLALHALRNSPQTESMEVVSERFGEALRTIEDCVAGAALPRMRDLYRCGRWLHEEELKLCGVLPGMLELAADLFGTGVRLGIPKENITGLADAVEAPRFATAVGLTQYGANRFAIGAGAPASKKIAINAPGMEKLVQRVRIWLQDFF
ncbi:MAG TPA: hypothetical protein VGC99_11875 [Candidatus Tectomicrobia bacterium]